MIEGPSDEITTYLLIFVLELVLRSLLVVLFVAGVAHAVVLLIEGLPSEHICQRLEGVCFLRLGLTFLFCAVGPFLTSHQMLVQLLRVYSGWLHLQRRGSELLPV